MEWLRISTSNELVRVRTEEIVPVKADGNYSDLLLTNGKSHKMTFQPHFFEDTSRQLQRNFLVRAGRGIIVNRRFIYIINLTEQTLTLAGHPMAGEVRVNASREALKQVKAMLEEEKGGTGNE